MDLKEKARIMSEVAQLDKNIKKTIYSALQSELYTNKKKEVSECKNNKRKTRRTYTQAQHRKAMELRVEGASVKKIARETGIRQNSVYNCLKTFRGNLEL